MLRTFYVMSLTFKWTILVTDALLFSSKINLTTMIERSMKMNRSFGSEPCSQDGYWFSIVLRFRWRLRYIWMKKLKIIIIEFYKIVKILRAPWLVKKQPLIAPINPWKIEVCVIKVTDSTFYQFTNVVNVSRCWETIRKSKLIERAMNKWGKSLKKLWCCVGGRV